MALNFPQEIGSEEESQKLLPAPASAGLSATSFLKEHHSGWFLTWNLEYATFSTELPHSLFSFSIPSPRCLQIASAGHFFRFPVGVGALTALRGREGTHNFLLPYLISFMNDPAWEASRVSAFERVSISSSKPNLTGFAKSCGCFGAS